jgi:hypothetical protein
VRRLIGKANVPSSSIIVTPMMEALGSSETSVLTRATQRNIPEGGILDSLENGINCVYEICLSSLHKMYYI